MSRGDALYQSYKNYLMSPMVLNSGLRFKLLEACSSKLYILSLFWTAVCNYQYKTWVINHNWYAKLLLGIVWYDLRLVGKPYGARIANPIFKVILNFSSKQWRLRINGFIFRAFVTFCSNQIWRLNTWKYGNFQQKGIRLDTWRTH